MFLLPSLLIGLALAIVLGGKPSRLADVRFRLTPLVLLALALQVVLFTKLGASLDPLLVDALHMGSYGLLLLFAVANVRIRTLIPVLAGIGLNAVAIIANGGHMPISREAAATVRELKDTNVSPDAERLTFLGDIFALPSQLPVANTFSIGDLLIGFGMIAFVVIASLERSERALSSSRIFEPLRIRSYRYLALGRLVSSIGDWLTLAALIGWIYHETGSTGNVAIILLVRLAPPILGAGLAAFVVDRVRKERLLVLVELCRGAAVAVALAGVLTGQLLAVFIALGVSGGLLAMSNAAVPSLLPALVPREQLPAANAALGLAKDGAIALGAVGAGVALSWLGAAVALAADVGTFVVAILLFSCIRSGEVRPSPEEEEPAGGSGLRYLLASRALVFLIVSFGAATLATGLTNASLPRFLEHELGFGASGYGFGIAALATGLALGQAVVGFTRVGPTAGRWIGIGLALMAGLFVVLGLTEHPPTALLIIGLIGFVDGTTDVLFETVVQREADPRRLGAVFGFASAFITTTMLGAVAVAPLANTLVAPHTVIIGTSAFLAVAGFLALVGMRSSASARPVAETTPARTRVLRTGSDLTIVTSAALAARAKEAVSALEHEFSIEVVSAPTFATWDRAVVLASLEKTAKLLVVHDNSGNEALAAEIVATVVDEGFELLDAPVRRAAVDDQTLTARIRDLAEF